MKENSHKQIEKRWQAKWKKDNTYITKDTVKGKKNFYHLVMFPYPSGNLHIGHWYNFAPADVLARYTSMSGYNVLSPIGFDAFGLPAENAAIKRGIHPRVWTYKNISTMRAQLESMGNRYDWSRMIITADPQYYKWTQWIFLELFKRGLMYRKKAPANWCPSCHTVLANEQVVDGKCERCGSEVVQREIEQWLFKITAYADRLLSDLDKIDWPEKTKTMQRNWIGKSEGALVRFPIVPRTNADTTRTHAEYNSKSSASVSNGFVFIEVFTTRIDTIFSGTFLIIAPEHKLISQLKPLIQNFSEVEKYVTETQKRSTLQRTDLNKEKNGVELKGVRVINPATGKEMPVWIADFVLANYGTGVVFADAHDERDFEFAKKYNIPLAVSIRPSDDAPWKRIEQLQECFSGDGVLVNSGQFNGLTSQQARPKIVSWLAERKMAQFQTQYKLRDWLISRQRYWGAPIPLVFCPACKIQEKISNFQFPISNKTSNSKSKRKLSKGEILNPGWFSVPEKELPVKLPNVKNYLPTNEGKSPLAHAKSFVNTTCPRCGGKAMRETDTMDTFMCSSWYFLRYTDPHNNKEFADQKKMKNWLPVDMYIGGAEHAVMHLLYVRFLTKVLYDAKHISFKEPFSVLRHQGIILGHDGQKMSKSKGNVVDPDSLVREFGADAVRMYLCFMGPYEQGGPWQEGGIVGVVRFLERVEKLYKKFPSKSKTANSKKNSEKIKQEYHQTIKKVGEDIANLNFNTAVSALMVFLRSLEQEPYLEKEIQNGFLKLLAPFAPFITEELWHQMGNKKSIHIEQWPKFNKKYLRVASVVVVCQVNGKKRAIIKVASGSTKDEVLQIARKDAGFQKYVADKEVTRIIFVPDKILNIIIK